MLHAFVREGGHELGHERLAVGLAVLGGAEVRGPDIKSTGWWTLGMSITPDGMVHYYIKQGVDDLTSDDYVTSQYPYGYRAEMFKTFFFNVCNRDDMRTQSTEWIVDDPAVYVATGASNLARKQTSPRRAGRRSVTR